MRSPAILSRNLHLRPALLAASLIWTVFSAPVSGAPAPAPAQCKPPLELVPHRADDFPPPPTDSRGYDVLSYDLDLRLDPVSRSISGQVVIRLAAAADSGGELTLIQLDLVPEMTVTRVFTDRRDLTYTHLGSRLEIDLNQPLPVGATDTVTVVWHGLPPRHGSFFAGLMFRSHDPGTPTDPTDDVPIIANLSQTWSAHSWWPCKDHPADKALVSLAATVPAPLSVVSNGSLEAVTNPEPGWRRYAWRERYPMPTYLVSVAASNYETWSETCAPPTGPPLRLDYHIFPEDRANAEHDLALTCDMMSFLTDLLGPWPYPGEKYAQVEFKWIGGMEHTTAASLAQLLFTGDRRWENLFLHELVHQWCGDSLTPAVWSDIWLNEGFARYGEALWVEHRYGPEAYRDFMLTIGPGGHPELFRGDGILSDPDPILPSTLVYDKGAWVLHMLRELIGREKFARFLRSYASDPRFVHGLVTVDDMIAVAEATAGRSLTSFFRPWLETDLTPDISHEISLPSPGRVELTLTQHQSRLFEIPVPVVLYGNGCETRITVALTGARQTFVWDLDCPIDSVGIAPDGLALLRTTDSPPQPLAAVGPTPNPAGVGGAEFTLFLTRDAEVVVKIYDITGKNIYREDIGPLAATGPADEPTTPGHLWRWVPGADGRPVPASGLYYLEFRGGGGRQVRRLTLIR